MPTYPSNFNGNDQWSITFHLDLDLDLGLDLDLDIVL